MRGSPLKTADDVLAMPLQLRTEELPNRLAKSAMTEGLADGRGQPTPELSRLYRLWANGGAGLLITGNAAVNAEHLERPGNVIVRSGRTRDMIAALRNWTDAGRCCGGGMWMQLNHAGRQTPSRVNRSPLAPSNIALDLPGKQFGRPQAMTEPQILQTVRDFAEASAIARDAGFTGVQIHAAHGYLVSQFLSPLANIRTDAWGGSLENRARLLLEIIAAIRRAAGHDFTLSVKLNSADFQRGGFTTAESMEVAAWIETAGIDVIEVSGGDYQQPRMMNMAGLDDPEIEEIFAQSSTREAYFLNYARQLLRRTRCPVMVTGGFRSAVAMREALENDGISLIGLARPMVLEPDAPRKLLQGAGELDRSEDRLRLGPGLFGPKSSIKSVRAINGFGALHWQYQQLRRLADGRGVNPKLGILAALAQEYRDQHAWIRQQRAIDDPD